VDTHRIYRWYPKTNHGQNNRSERVKKGGDKMKNTRGILVGILLAMMLVLTTAMPALAATSTDIVVTGTPSYISFSSLPAIWTINGITGSGAIQPNTTYYANPLGDTTVPSATVLDTQCQFAWTNDSSVNINVSVNFGAFTGGGADMTNSNTGTNGPTTYGAYSWYSGITYASKVIVKDTGSATLYTTATPGEDKKWGCEIKTRTDAWTSGTSSTSTMTILATAS
jgi:hypothetical protein